MIFSLCFAAVAEAAPTRGAAAGVEAEAEPGFDKQAREILEGLLAVDTSNGNETAALRPIAQRFAGAGIPFELLESSPGRGNLVARLRGSGKRKPLLLLAHIDVVPVEGQSFSTPPFFPTEKDGYLCARGVGDDKSMAAAIVATALELARKRTPLARDVIVALTAGEETGGAAGVRFLVEHYSAHEPYSEQGAGSASPAAAPPQKAGSPTAGTVGTVGTVGRGVLDAAIALNEGGSLLLAPDEQALRFVGIGSAEKSYQSYALTVHGKGGHSSMPSAEADPVTRLARALVKLGELRFPARVLPAVSGSLALRARWERPALAEALRRAVASAPSVTPADDAILSAEPSVNNMIRTTCVATMLEAAARDNVLPTTVTATVNCRLLPDDTREATLATLMKAIGDPAVQVRPLEDIGVGPASPVDGEVPDAIRRAAGRLWPKAEVVHTMGAGATDSRYLRALGIAAYGISCGPITLDDADKGHGAHGPDERRPLRWLPDGARYLREITLELTR